MLGMEVVKGLVTSAICKARLYQAFTQMTEGSYNLGDIYIICMTRSSPKFYLQEPEKANSANSSYDL